jgi:flagellar FliJ protein
MAIFRFSLRKLLRLKEQIEDSVKNDLGIAIRALEYEKERLASIDAEISALNDEFRKACTGSIRTEKIKEIKAYLEVRHDDRKRQAAVVKNCEENVDKIREKLVNAMKERKVLENLREREFEKFRQQEGRDEQKLTDELVSYKESVKKDNSA